MCVSVFVCLEGKLNGDVLLFFVLFFLVCDVYFFIDLCMYFCYLIVFVIFSCFVAVQ